MSLFLQGGRVSTGALLVLLLGLLPSGASADVSVAIVPPYVEKVVRSGSQVSDTLSYTNQGSDPVIVQVDFSDFGVNESGEVTEQPPGSHSSSLIRHLRISPMKIRVVPDQQVFFRYSVETPEVFDQLRSMIFLSSYPETDPGANQVQIVARLGVPLYVENTKAAPAQLEIESVEWDRPEKSPDQLRVRLLVSNHGQRNIRPGGFVHVETADGKFNTTFDFNQGREPVLPGQRRRWEQFFGPVPEGKLEVKLRLATSARTSYEAESFVAAVTP